MSEELLIHPDPVSDLCMESLTFFDKTEDVYVLNESSVGLRIGSSPAI